jgi:hypothetical protein
MLFRVIAAAGLAAALALPLPAVAETSLTAYEAARQALLAIWTELPLTARNATLTEGPATGYGNYVPRTDATYKAGERIEVYTEVLGYGWKDNGDGTNSELLDADLNLLSASGATLASKEKFLSAEIKSRLKPFETFLTFNATLTAFDPGAYKLQFVLHDRAGGKSTTFELPITLTAADDASSSSAASDASVAGQASSSAQ